MKHIDARKLKLLQLLIADILISCREAKVNECLSLAAKKNFFSATIKFQIIPEDLVAACSNLVKE